MDPRGLVQLLVRRWRVVLPTMLLTVAVAGMAVLTSTTTYVASGWMVLEQPDDQLQDGLADGTQTSIDPAELALAGDASGVGSGATSVQYLGGDQFALAAAGDTREDSIREADELFGRLEALIAQIQEEDGVPPQEQLELLMASPDLLTEQQPDASFRSSATIFLHDPTTTAQNPYLPVASTARLLEVAAMGDDIQARLSDTLGPGYVVEVSPPRPKVYNPYRPDERVADVVLSVEVTGPTRPDAVAAFDTVRGVLAGQLDQWQADAAIPVSGRTTLRPLDRPLGAIEQTPSLKRGLVGIVVLGGLLALGLALAADGIARIRRQRAPGRASQVDGGSPRRPSPGSPDRVLSSAGRPGST